ncbi:ABC transporter ATP-binding protein [Solibacillus sp. CAU 1738]|uniref:ABC transporter ATP-binding protein n=1 Tax=Solibacillus sp. CAU 1738 TaxID=3140363 RepID=UPI0032612517
MIQCTELTKSYRGKQALAGVTCALDEQKIIGLVGRNGAGKSTMLKILAGHLKPTDGEVCINNDKPFNNLTVATNTILIEEAMTFPNNSDVAHILKSAEKFYPNWQGDLAKKLLSYAGLSPKNFHYNLSKGQRSTFNLIYGLASRCAVTLLDEPMNGMDEAIRSDMYRAILKEYIAHPRTIIISSHHLKEIEHLIEEILLIDNGKVALHESLEHMQQYAVRLIGQRDALEQYRTQANILFEKQEAPFAEMVVQAQTLTLNEQQLRDANIQVLPVSASDVCKYVTAKSRGGIDDVFE